MQENRRTLLTENINKSLDIAIEALSNKVLCTQEEKDLLHQFVMLQESIDKNKLNVTFKSWD